MPSSSSAEKSWRETTSSCFSGTSVSIKRVHLKAEIVDFIKLACKKFDLKALYIPDGDIYVIHKDGRAVQNFTSAQFYQMPKRARMNEYEPLVKIGLATNLGSPETKDQLFLPINMGKRIVWIQIH